MQHDHVHRYTCKIPLCAHKALFTVQADLHTPNYRTYTHLLYIHTHKPAINNQSSHDHHSHNSLSRTHTPKDTQTSVKHTFSHTQILRKYLNLCSAHAISLTALWWCTGVCVCVCMHSRAGQAQGQPDRQAGPVYIYPDWGEWKWGISYNNRLTALWDTRLKEKGTE